MRTLPALVALSAAALVPNTALAGGIGLFGTGGMHGTKAYYYNSNLQQGVDIQQRANGGGGVEVLIGDKDDRVNGIMRLYANVDVNPGTPDFVGVNQSNAIWPKYADSTRTDLAATMGIQWGLLGEPDGQQLILTSMFGSAFATVDNQEYFIGDLGVGGTMMLSDIIQLSGTINAQTRYRKSLSFAGGAYISARYMFD